MIHGSVRGEWVADYKGYVPVPQKSGLYIYRPLFILMPSIASRFACAVVDGAMLNQQLLHLHMAAFAGVGEWALVV